MCNIWFHICHECIYYTVRVFICSDTCIWILWIHWIHELICYMNSFICVKSYVTTNSMNSLNTWYDLTAEFTLINVFYNHFTSRGRLYSTKMNFNTFNLARIFSRLCAIFFVIRRMSSHAFLLTWAQGGRPFSPKFLLSKSIKFRHIQIWCLGHSLRCTFTTSTSPALS